MKNNKIRNITLGAMFIAIYGALLFINNTMGSLFSDVLPIVLTTSILLYFKCAELTPLVIGLLIVTILFGNITTYIYSFLFVISGVILTYFIKKGVTGKKIVYIMLVQFFICEIIGRVLVLFALGINIFDYLINLSSSIHIANQSIALFIALFNCITLSFVYSIFDSLITMKLSMKLNKIF